MASSFNLPSLFPYYLSSKPVYSSETAFDVSNKYSGESITRVSLADDKIIDRAIEDAEKAQLALNRMVPYERQNILKYCIEQFELRFEELAYVLCLEAGKPINDARGEVTRLIETFKIAAEESVRITGDVIELQTSPRTKGYSGMTKRVPIGVCSFITPFNFPLNLVAHKIAPAIATGCAFILKPASKTPLGALMIGEILSQSDLPTGAFSILPCGRDGAQRFTTDERLKLLSFTGSSDVGWQLKADAGKKSVILELGGNAACLVDHDSNIPAVVERVVYGAYYQSGQSCISVQRVFVHEKIYAEFKTQYLQKVKSLKHGDPLDETTFVGPLIDKAEVRRISEWIEQAKNAGASILCGGQSNGTVLDATVLENVSPNCDIYAQEVFGPVSMLIPFSNFDEALSAINESRFGLQAGLFVTDINKINYAWEKLDVGGVIVGDAPSWRADNMPYGGVKDSGIGREGVVDAIEHMTEQRLLVVKQANEY